MINQMECLRVIKDNEIIGYRLVDTDTTYDWLTTKMCKNMQEVLDDLVVAEYDLPTTPDKDTISTENYIVVHQNKDSLIDFYQKYEVKVASDTVYVQNGLAFFVYAQNEVDYTVDILCTTKESYELLVTQEILDKEDVQDRVNFLFTGVTSDKMMWLNTHAIRGSLMKDEILYFINKQLVQKDKKDETLVKGLVYEFYSLDDFLTRSRSNIIRLGV